VIGNMLNPAGSSRVSPGAPARRFQAVGGNNVAKWHGRTAIQHHAEHFKG